MTTLTEQTAELLIAAHAFDPATPGFVGATLDLPVTAAPAQRVPLRHGFLDPRSPHLATVSGPPSPGLAASLARMRDDLAAAQTHCSQSPCSPRAGAGGVRVALEAGLDAAGPLGLAGRWTLAHTLAPVLAAAFANSPLLGGEPSGWRSVRQARHRELPVLPAAADPRRAWASFVLDAAGRDGRTFRERARSGERPRLADLAEHVDALRPPVAARGHLEIDVADRQPGDGWQVVVAVTSVLLDDPRAAAAAAGITAPLAAEPGLWERAARDALTDPVLATAARECFVTAYGALGRRGESRELRDAVAEFTERYVMRGRCPADDVLDRAAARN
ncbi:hypothetical protein Ade02nite_95990 [Paractinoplanes deccanensis]|uniref:glutamate--cysteine ligase n=1 Tax=Paractinoplanes deccanensis TaxID=113561 RepID=A0ABQ3YLT7_9ACTN|nr:glutamate-cysteine ligase family protein [Actinoplanes deccanensis]GID80958.1 hypothetical protein Ade02nite_95990 [Actinoplanes deccanensis]